MPLLASASAYLKSLCFSQLVLQKTRSRPCLCACFMSSMLPAVPKTNKKDKKRKPVRWIHLISLRSHIASPKKDVHHQGSCVAPPTPDKGKTPNPALPCTLLLYPYPLSLALCFPGLVSVKKQPIPSHSLTGCHVSTATASALGQRPVVARHLSSTKRPSRAQCRWQEFPAEVFGPSSSSFGP